MTAERSPHAFPPAVSRGFALPATRHSILERLRDQEPERQRVAFGDLAAGYWKPLYKHFRLRWRLAPADAEDAVLGLIVGYATQRFGRAPAPATH